MFVYQVHICNCKWDGHTDHQKAQNSPTSVNTHATHAYKPILLYSISNKELINGDLKTLDIHNQCLLYGTTEAS